MSVGHQVGSIPTVHTNVRSRRLSQGPDGQEELEGGVRSDLFLQKNSDQDKSTRTRRVAQPVSLAEQSDGVTPILSPNRAEWGSTHPLTLTFGVAERTAPRDNPTHNRHLDEDRDQRFPAGVNAYAAACQVLIVAELGRPVVETPGPAARRESWLTRSGIPHTLDSGTTSWPAITP